MSNASSDPKTDKTELTKHFIVPWHPILGLVFIVATYYAAQITASIVLYLYALLNHWTQVEAASKLNGSVTAQFVYILITELLIVGAIYLFLRMYRLGFASIGLKKFRLNDLFYGLAAVPVYFILYLITVGLISHFVPGLDINQEQQLGFNNVHGLWPLAMTFVALVILPPLVEEIMVRGFLYSTLKKAMPTIGAVIATSAVFAAAHLPEGGAAGPLYIAALDTFVLSLVLIYLREKTGSLWASITLHGFKNGIAFVALFVLHLN
ncbi:MAG: CPBP family intramembrane glutamic endopeptidase [Patescibacteria group bacterium]